MDKPVEIQRPVTEISDIPEDTGVQVTKSTADEMVVAIDKQEVTATVELVQVKPEQKAVLMAEPVSRSDETGELKLDPADTEEEIQPDLAKTEAELPSDPKKTEAEITSAPVKIEMVEVARKEVTQGSDAAQVDTEAMPKYQGWLDAKLQQSRNWLINARRNNVSIQVLMRKKTSERELINYLQNEWPLNLDKTYLYEVEWNSQSIYRVFYSEFGTLTQGRNEMQLLPDSLKANSPYLHSVYQMQKALL